MKNAQKPDHISLNTLINRLKEGRFEIPDFQREFEWKASDICGLMRSIFLDYYIGSLLLWKGKAENFKALSCEKIYGFTGNGKPEYIVLDGQQRLTAMYYAFVAPDVPIPNKANRALYFIKIDELMTGNDDEAFKYDWLEKRWSKILNNPELQYETHTFPLSVVGKGGWDLPNWVQGYTKYWQDKAEKAESEGDKQIALKYSNDAVIFGEQLKEITEQYQISYIELDEDIEVDKVCDIFTQVNSKGIRLDVFDLMNAMLKPKGMQLKQAWREAKQELAFADTERMNVYILQVMSILLQAYCSPKYLYFLLPGQEKPIRDPDGTRHKEVLIQNVEAFQDHWNEAVAALKKTVATLRHPQEFGVTSSKYLPYVSILPAFAALLAAVEQLPPNRHLTSQRKIRQWYWASIFTNRYSGSVESTSARDFLDVKAWLENDLAEPALIMEFKRVFKNLDLRKETKRGSSIYNGIFNLLVINGARDWVKGSVPDENLDDHHIIPDSWGEEHLSAGIVNTILNRTPLTSDTNRNFICDRLPNEYLPELMKSNGEETVRAVLESHFISPQAMEILLRNPFTPDDFEAFIAERQRTIQSAIENLLIKERLDLSKDLRQLDADLEAIELNLRQLISVALNQNVSLLPPHLQEKAQDRIQRDAKKNAAFDMEYHQTLAGKLEFFDLRDLQELLTNKLVWSHFEPIFKNKEALNTKFAQLTELRNAIRHSRAVSEITRKEGEAALLWFNKVILPQKTQAA